VALASSWAAATSSLVQEVAWPWLRSSGTRFECVKEECCPLSGQKIKGRDEVVIENSDRIVVNIFKMIDDRELRVGEIVSIRQK
jgi:hypothetical protein